MKSGNLEATDTTLASRSSTTEFVSDSVGSIYSGIPGPLFVERLNRNASLLDDSMFLGLGNGILSGLEIVDGFVQPGKAYVGGLVEVTSPVALVVVLNTPTYVWLTITGQVTFTTIEVAPLQSIRLGLVTQFGTVDTESFVYRYALGDSFVNWPSDIWTESEPILCEKVTSQGGVYVKDGLNVWTLVSALDLPSDVKNSYIPVGYTATQPSGDFAVSGNLTVGGTL